MTPIQNLNSFFINKIKFEREFANFGFRFNDTLKQELKELKKSNEFDKELINKYIFIQSEQYFFKSIEQNLGEFAKELCYKVNVVGQNDLKSEFIFSNIQYLIKLLEKIELIFKEYPQIDIEKLHDIFEHFIHYAGIKNKEPLDIKTSDDILEEIISIVNEIRPVTKNILLKFYDFEYSDVYMGFLIKTSIAINNSIQRIILENKDILTEKYDILEDPPFIISREQQKVINKTPKTFEEVFYNIDFVNPCIDILKELKSPFVDADYNYIGKLKGIYCIWIEELTKQGIIKGYSERKIYASLIPTKIKGFSIDESMFGKYHKRAENYRLDIKSKISIIKLSQVSQKEN